jgi:hypothetical protein
MNNELTVGFLDDLLMEETNMKYSTLKEKYCVNFANKVCDILEDQDDDN